MGLARDSLSVAKSLTACGHQTVAASSNHKKSIQTKDAFLPNCVVRRSAHLDLPHLPSVSGPDPLKLITAGIGSVAIVVVTRCNAETDTRSNEAAAESATMTTAEMTTATVISAAMTTASKSRAAAADRQCGYSYNC
jgi:hypothetical protein